MDVSGTGMRDANIDRDKTVRKELLELKIKQLIIWECTIRKMKKDEVYRDKIVEQIIDFLGESDYFLEI